MALIVEKCCDEIKYFSSLIFSLLFGSPYKLVQVRKIRCFRASETLHVASRCNEFT